MKTKVVSFETGLINLVLEHQILIIIMRHQFWFFNRSV